MEVAARLATAADSEELAAIARVGRAAIAGARGADVWLARDAVAEPLEAAIARHAAQSAAGTAAVVAGTIDDSMIGLIILATLPAPDGHRAVDLAEVFVIDGARGVGVGEAMMRVALEWAEASALVGVGGRALPGDRATKNYFESHGITARSIEVYRPLPVPGAHD